MNKILLKATNPARRRHEKSVSRTLSRPNKPVERRISSAATDSGKGSKEGGNSISTICRSAPDTDSGGSGGESEPPPNNLIGILNSAEPKYIRPSDQPPYCSAALDTNIPDAEQNYLPASYTSEPESPAGSSSTPIPQYDSFSAWQKMQEWIAAGKYVLSSLWYDDDEVLRATRLRMQQHNDGMQLGMVGVDRVLAWVYDL